MEKNFDRDINTILKEIDFEDVKETIWDWFFSLKKDKFVCSKLGMFYVLYDLAEYDYITVTEDGFINEDASNSTLIARILQQYVSTDVVQKVYSAIFE